MLHWFSTYGISAPLAIAIIALGVIQLTLQIYALIDLVRRPAPDEPGRKMVFAAVIVLAGLLGAIAYLAVGRPMLAPKSEGGSVGGDSEAARQRALDQLYGPDQRP